MLLHEVHEEDPGDDEGGDCEDDDPSEGGEHVDPPRRMGETGEATPPRGGHADPPTSLTKGR